MPANEAGVHAGRGEENSIMAPTMTLLDKEKFLIMAPDLLPRQLVFEHSPKALHKTRQTLD